MPPMIRTALVLGLLSAVSPFAIDMYLPAMPAIESELGAGVSGTQATITAYFLSFGLAQLIYGPLADRFGRKPPIFAGLGIFLVGTVLCAVAPDIRFLIGARFLQGLGGAALMVVPRAIIRDLHTGPEAAKLMAMIMLVIFVSPMLAPLAGSGVIAIGGWRGVFWVIAAASLVSLALLAFAQPETLRPENRAAIEPRALRRNAGILLRDPVFMGLTFVGGLGISSFFVFLTSAPFVYTGTYGLSPTGFSIAFAMNAIGFFAASQAAGPLGERLGMETVVFWATAGFAAVASALVLVVLAGGGSLPVVVGMLFLANAFLGLVIPSTMVMALDPHPEIAGLASSLGGTLQMVAGAVAVTLASPFFDGSVLPMVAAIALCGISAFAVALLVDRSGRRQAV
ncbi:multidrug effflux MFS transporter [Silicimonas algicola]|uniref:Bcr/CflA family efflux transporter n=1 Tax=Silicimonas algicola TaxID=1826607 RepID=A0A316G9G9_9RHOB|nr:DHA1 family bicyclomycin/chloramphenicol resistance-like MFS transporter [Silicimonas algicola]